MERAFIYGDLLFETMLVEHGRIPHITRHYRRLADSALHLKIDLCGLNEEKFTAICTQKIEEFEALNPEANFLRLRAVLYREAKGNYLPLSHQGKLAIQINEIKPLVQPEILRFGIYTAQQKAPGALANFKSGNALIYVMASIWAEENKLDSALILNTQNHLIESCSCNIFWRENNSWFTPPLSDGCVAGIGRQLFMEANVVIEKNCSPKMLLDAAECIVTNALQAPRNFSLVELA